MKFTEWFSIDVKPVRKGVYQVGIIEQDKHSKWFSYWNGVTFSYHCLRPQTAFNSRNMRGCGPQTKFWRGIAK